MNQEYSKDFEIVAGVLTKYCGRGGGVVIPQGVTSIGEDAFKDCKSLTTVTIPDSVTGIGDRAFCHTAYYNNADNWEDDVLYIGNHLIEAKATISGDYVIKNGTKTFADLAFDDCECLT